MAKKKAAGTVGAVARKRGPREIQVKLSAEERMAAGQSLAEKYIERDEVEARKKERNSEFKAELAAIDKVIRDASQLLHGGTRTEIAECETIYDYGAGTVTVVRVKTGEIVEEHPMEAGERQAEIAEQGD